MEMRSYNLPESFIQPLSQIASLSTVISINGLNAVLMRANVMFTERRTAKESDLSIGSCLDNPPLTLFGLR